MINSHMLCTGEAKSEVGSKGGETLPVAEEVSRLWRRGRRADLQ